jgi:hypothetical protein
MFSLAFVLELFRMHLHFKLLYGVDVVLNCLTLGQIRKSWLYCE